MPCILIIDDDQQVRRLLRQCLEPDGHHLIEAADGAKGLEQFAAHAVDLVVIDLILPEYSGWDTINELQERSPGTPFIVISGGAPLEGLKRGSGPTLESLRRVAPFQVLRKPLEWGAINAAVDALLARPRTAMGGV